MSDTERDKFLEQLYELYFDRLVRFCRWYLRAYPDLYYMVEVGGIEPPSESLLTSFSPSAATILGFPSPVASRRAAGYGSFMITDDASKLWRARSPHS